MKRIEGVDIVQMHCAIVQNRSAVDMMVPWGLKKLDDWITVLL